mgnify:FL=1
MIFFGHLGLTTGIIKVYEKAAHKDEGLIDYRVVLTGSLLPDIIDKPIGAFLFRNTFHNSRIFSHTLLFAGLLTLAGIYFLRKYKKNNMLLLGICSFIHLLLDSMWEYPAILFWPYFGWKFPVRPEGNWMQESLLRFVTDPGYYIPEFIGFIIIAYYSIKLAKNKQLKTFVRHGTCHID